MDRTVIFLPPLMILSSFRLPMLCGGVGNFAVNIAYGKPATQSSTYIGRAEFKDTPGYQYAASLAVDGNKNTSFKDDGCSHTDWTNNSAWWEVDLLGLYKVSIITIYQRTDDNKNWLSGFVTRGKLTNGSFVIIDNLDSLKPGTVTIHVQTSMKFKGIRIELDKNTPAAICLCEVEVLAEINVAENKPATQSTDYKDNSAQSRPFTASFAVDGKTTTDFSKNSCSCTKPGERSAWWKVDLEALFLIIGIKIYQRSDANKDRLSGFALFGLIANGSYEQIRTPDPYHTDVIEISISPPRMFKEIMVQLNHSLYDEGPIITLCEVQVFAESMCWKQPPFPRRNLHIVKEGNGSNNFSLQCIEGYSIARPISDLCVGINRWVRTFGRCSDIDECIIRPSACQNRGHCSDSNGNFVCMCNPGYKGAACENVVRCNNSLTQPAHGKLNYIGGINGTGTYNTVVTVSCEEGYTLTMATDVRCSKSGEWEGSTGICSVIRCPPLQYNGKNGRLHYINKGLENLNNSFGARYRIECDMGYVSNTTSEIVCTTRETWNTIIDNCQVIRCPPLHYSGKNGSLHYINKGLENRDDSFGARYRIECDTGYVSNTTSEIVCTTHATWNTTIDNCQVIRCPPLHYSGKNGSLHHIHTGLENRDDSFGARYRIQCDTGYVSNTTSEIVCTTRATWNTTIDNCQVVQCADLVIQENTGFVLYHPGIEGNLTYNTTVSMRCHDRYSLTGRDLVVCNEYGHWDGILGNCSETHEHAEPESGVTGIAGGVAAAVCVVTLGVIVALILYKRRRKGPEDRTVNTTLNEIPSSSDGKNEKGSAILDKSIYAEPKERKNTQKDLKWDESKNVYMNSNDTSKDYYSFTPQKVTDKHSVRIEDVSSFFLSRKNEPRLYEEEYNKLPTGLIKPHEVALLAENRSKNRYKNIYPYDDTRVTLEIWDPSNENDYINACYVNGFKTFHAYIAAQGPTKGILNDFWRMIWQNKCSKIVMLTNLMEEGKHKCEKYWPDEGSMKFGDICIRLVQCETFSDFTIRTLEMRMKTGQSEAGKNEVHQINQFHFTAWPDRGVPRFASSLIQFRQKIRVTKTRRNTDGPMVIHCSAGIGRTGTFLALDYLLDQAEELGYINVVNCLETIRKQRVSLVQTVEQYKFLHEAIVEALTCTTMVLSTSEFQETYRRLLERDTKTGKRKLDDEFEKLPMYVSDPGEEVYENAKNMENRQKNRYSNILPDKNHCPFLNVYVKARDSYINAVFLPAYKENDIFIITQMPLENTVVDFWRMVYQFEVGSIVMLNTLSEMKEEERYWTEDKAFEIAPFKITLESKYTDDHWTNYIMLLNYNNERRRVRLSRATYWPDGKPIPKSPSAMLKQIDLIQNWQQETCNKPIIVHCMNGAERSGLFCVIAALLERIKIEHDVAVEQIIKQMRSRRPQIIPNVDQFKFCYDAVLAYLDTFDTYSNFTGM